MKPRHRLVHALRDVAQRKSRPGDHDHRQAEFARRIDLGARTFTTGILGDDMGDGMAAHQRKVVLQPEGAPRKSTASASGRGRGDAGASTSRNR